MNNVLNSLTSRHKITLDRLMSLKSINPTKELFENINIGNIFVFREMKSFQKL